MVPLPPAQIPDTEVRILRSTQVEQDYRISVAVPYQYPDFPEKNLPECIYSGRKLVFWHVHRNLSNALSVWHDRDNYRGNWVSA